ncbi:MAG: pirin family protein [Nocardioidaceae bacterium]
MSNLEADPAETVCPASEDGGPAALSLPSREVPLGGVRGTSVRRSLPHRDIPTVGAWCFLDHFGPTDHPMDILPHPHTGLQTVTWPLSGRLRHRDSLGSDVVVRPGELNLMTSGAGVSHSEFTSDLADPADAPLDGLQLWVALPEDVRHGSAAFEHHEDLPVLERGSSRATVLVGSLEDQVSPAEVHSPLVGAEITLRPGDGALELERSFEYAVQVIDGRADVNGEALAPDTLLFLGSGRAGLDLRTEAGARLLLLGGVPFEEELVMWWNFIGRSHAEVEQARTQWEASADRFGSVAGHAGARIPAPPLPNVRLTPRRRR